MTSPNNINDAAIAQVLDKVVSYGLATGRFESVNQHEPKNSPGTGVTAAVWVQNIRPIRSSGLSATSGVLLLSFRIYVPFLQQPFDSIDPNVLSATVSVMGALSADFDFGGVADVRNLDLLGANGTALSANAGYVDIDRKIFRVMTVSIPVVINDMFAQVA